MDLLGEGDWNPARGGAGGRRRGRTAAAGPMLAVNSGKRHCGQAPRGSGFAPVLPSPLEHDCKPWPKAQASPRAPPKTKAAATTKAKAATCNPTTTSPPTTQGVQTFTPAKRKGRASRAAAASGLKTKVNGGVDVRLGTDFGGMDTPLIALETLGYKVQHVFNSEKNCSCIKLSKTITSPDCEVRYKDITERVVNDVPKCDLYVAGIPCIPWCAGGNEEGLDHKDGPLWMEAITYIKTKLPKGVVLECAPTLLQHRKFEESRRQFVRMIEDEGYEVHVNLMRTDEHGLPQTRVRFYLVGIKTSAKRRAFTWPAPLQTTIPLHKIIKGNKVTTLKGMLPDGDREKDHVLRALQSAAASGVKLTDSRIIVDIGGTSQFAHYTVDEFPTITATRATSFDFWVADLGRRVKLDELMLLQGFTTNTFQDRKKAKVTDARQAHMLGNGMSCNVLERLFPNVLSSIGIDLATPPIDRWAIAASRASA